MFLCKYILDDAWNPVPVTDVLAWGRWMETHERHLSHDIQEDARDGKTIRISTVFLGIDHQFGLSGPPVLWETMVFGGVLDGYQDRYTSRAAALAGHQAVCRRVALTLAREG